MKSLYKQVPDFEDLERAAMGAAMYQIFFQEVEDGFEGVDSLVAEPDDMTRAWVGSEAGG